MFLVLNLKASLISDHKNVRCLWLLKIASNYLLLFFQIVADVHDGGGDGAGVAAPRPRRVNYGSVGDSSSNIRTEIEEVQGEEDGEAEIVQAEEVRVTYAR